MEATPGLEPGIRALQAPALPLGHVASNRVLKVRGKQARVNLPAARWCYMFRFKNRYGVDKIDRTNAFDRVHKTHKLKKSIATNVVKVP